MKKIITSIVVILLFTSNLNISAHKIKKMPLKKSKEIAWIKVIGGGLLACNAAPFAIGGVCNTIACTFLQCKKNNSPNFLVGCMSLASGGLGITGSIIGVKIFISGLNDFREITQGQNSTQLNKLHTAEIR